MTPSQEQRLDDLIGGQADGLIEHAQAFVSFMNELEVSDQQKAMLLMMTRFRLPEFRTDSRIEGEKIELDHLQKLASNLGMMVEATVNYIVSTRMEPNAAAEEVTRLISSRNDLEEKTFCLAGIIGSNIVPYAVIPDSQVQMTNEEYQESLNTLPEGTSKIRIASGVSKNASEMADLVLSVIDEEEDRTKKVTLLSYFIVLRERTVATAAQAQASQNPT